MIVNEMYARSRYEGCTVYRETERRVDEGILERETERERIKKKRVQVSNPGTYTCKQTYIYIYTWRRECRAIFQWLRPSLNSR